MEDEREGGRHAEMGHRSDSTTLGNCSEDIASVHGAHILPTELLWGPISALTY